MTAARRAAFLLGILALVCPSVALAADENLIEYSYGGFADGDSVMGPMLLPPMVKIYQDGRIVFLDERGVWQGSLGEHELSRYKARLAAEPLLKKTRLIPVKKGDPAGLHGGMAYIRYLDGADEVVLGAMVLPRSGEWNRIVKGIRSHLPSSYSTFEPHAVSVQVLRAHGRAPSLQWPFAKELPLESYADHSVSIESPGAAYFILKNSRVGFSWLNCEVLDAGQTYSLIVNRVPGWYDPSHVALLLGDLAADVEK